MRGGARAVQGLKFGGLTSSICQQNTNPNVARRQYAAGCEALNLHLLCSSLSPYDKVKVKSDNILRNYTQCGTQNEPGWQHCRNQRSLLATTHAFSTICQCHRSRNAESWNEGPAYHLSEYSYLVVRTSVLGLSKILSLGYQMTY